jgi:hypothetical protein
MPTAENPTSKMVIAEVHMQRATYAVLSSGVLGVLTCLSPVNLIPQSSTTLNPYGNCPAPAREGIAVCAQPEAISAPSIYPSQVSPFQVIASATSGKGHVVLMELWADGQKIAEGFGTPFDETVTLPLGSHTLKIVAIDETGALVQSVPMPLSVEGLQPLSYQDCLPPSSPGVNVCAPEAGGCNTQPWVEFSAAARADHGHVVRMELWIGGTKFANFPGNHFDTSMVIDASFTTITVNAVDQKGRVLSQSLQYSGPC